MHSSNQTPGESESTHSKDGTQFEQALDQVEDLLRGLKQRYAQVQTARREKTELQQRLHKLAQELHQVKEQLEELEVDLESRLLSWRTHRELFWQIVRFVGLGFVLGQILNACTG